MIAFGLRASISAAGMVAGTISEYTWHSRTRRAMSCAYWAPKSTTSTVSKSGLGCTATPSARDRQFIGLARAGRTTPAPAVLRAPAHPARRAGRAPGRRLWFVIMTLVSPGGHRNGYYGFRARGGGGARGVGAGKT